MHGFSRIHFLFSALLWLLTLPACIAGPLDEAKAQTHLQAIATSDIHAVMQAYADDAYMDWVGGPLDGRYQGKAAIRLVWQKFFAANHGQPRSANVTPLKAHSNPKGTTLELVADYAGVTPVRVWHALVYRDGQLSTEIWQIAPAPAP